MLIVRTVNIILIIHYDYLQAILCLPKPLHREYSHLVTTPHLLLEQLLMNMKVVIFIISQYDNWKTDSVSFYVY